MNKELIDRVWKYFLPKEFKEEVKAHYAGLNTAYQALLGKDSLTNAECDRCNVMRENIVLYNMYFGLHNLTSDAEGEEMLTVRANLVRELYQRAKEIEEESKRAHSPMEVAKYRGVQRGIEDLFGSKCLPDEDSPIEATSAQTATSPTFKAGNKVCCISPEYKGVYKVCRYIENGFYSCVDSDGYYFVFHESNLEPYTEPVENHIAGERKMVDNILKDSFSKERRLNIAASIAAGWLAYHGMTNPETIAMDALAVADALIIEVEKTNNP